MNFLFSMKPKPILISIDMLPCLDNSYEIDDFLLGVENQIFEKSQQSPDAKVILFQLVWESGDVARFFDQLQELIYKLKLKYSDKKIFLICNSWFKIGGLHARLYGISDVLYVDFFLLRVYHKLIVNNESIVVKNWNPTNNSILFLTGVACKIHRIRLLYKFLQTDLRYALNYSLIIQEDEKDMCRGFFNDFPAREFNWMLSQQRTIGTFHKTGIPYQEQMYSNTLFQIISETNFDKPFLHPWITEKSWLSIVNCRPFIMASEFHTLDHLETLGFHTFREFLEIPNYDNPDRSDFLCYGALSHRTGTIITANQIKHWTHFYHDIKDQAWIDITTPEDIDLLPKSMRIEINQVYKKPIESITDMRLDALVQNALFWQANIHSYQHEILDKVQHNYNRFLSLGIQNQSRLIDFFTRNQINLTIDEFIYLRQ